MSTKHATYITHHSISARSDTSVNKTLSGTRWAFTGDVSNAWVATKYSKTLCCWVLRTVLSTVPSTVITSAVQQLNQWTHESMDAQTSIYNFKYGYASIHITHQNTLIQDQNNTTGMIQTWNLWATTRFHRFWHATSHLFSQLFSQRWAPQSSQYLLTSQQSGSKGIDQRLESRFCK